MPRHCRPPPIVYEDVRDDLNKGAPVSRPWRSLLKACQTEVDARERGPARARIAVLADVRGSTREEFRRFVSDLASDDPSLFSIEDKLGTMRGDPELSGREQEVLDQIERLSADGLGGRDLAEEAYRGILVRDSEAQLRALDGYLRVKVPREHDELMGRLRSSLIEGADISAIARELADGQTPTAPAPRTRPLDLDEDLRAPGSGSSGGP